MTTPDSPRYVRLLHGLVRPFPNFDFGFIQPIRRRAAGLLRLGAGGRVIDAGCGSGGSFPALFDAVGDSGEVVGIDISAESVLQARRRVEHNRWRNITVIASRAEAATLAGSFDGLLMFAAPDVFASRASLDHMLPLLRANARIVFFGAKQSTRWYGWLLNPLLHLALTRFSLPTTPGLEREPWRLVGVHVDELVVEELFFGWMFLAAGTLKPAAGQRAGASPRTGSEAAA